MVMRPEIPARQRWTTSAAAAVWIVLLTASCTPASGDATGVLQDGTSELPPPAEVPKEAAPPPGLVEPLPGPEPLSDAPLQLRLPPDPDATGAVRVREMQGRLIDFGAGGVKVTGGLTLETKREIARFQSCVGLPATGHPDAPTYKEMLKKSSLGWKIAGCPPATPSSGVQEAATSLPGAPPGTAVQPTATKPTTPDLTPGSSSGVQDPQRQQQAALPIVPPPPPPPVIELKVGDGAYGIESISCEGASGSWVLLYRGTVAQVNEDAVAISVNARFGLRYWPSAEGYDDSDWFCVPRRRFCYSQINFSDWHGKVTANERVSIPRDHVFSDRLRPVAAQPMIQRECAG